MRIEKEQIKELHVIGNIKTRKYLEENFEKAFVQKADVKEVPTAKPELVFFDVKEISKFTGLHTKTIERHCRNGTLEASKFGKKWLVSEENLQSYLNISKHVNPDNL